ncbi:MAG: DUF4102 domain-containing protein [Alphaproteobacteria bacterium]|nr:DUF4102 domain-containing protein [Alphaproteobacteria bacterium]
MPKAKLTDAVIRRLKPPPEGQADWWDSYQPGFGIRLSHGGSQTWVIQTRVLREGKWSQTRVTLGRYPAMTLADAREKARAVAQQASAGRDPRHAAKLDRAAMEAASRETFKSVGEDFIRRWVQRKGRRPATKAAYRTALLGSSVEEWQNRPIASITRREIREKLEATVEQAPIKANRFLAHWSRFFGWCLEMDLIEIDPTAGITRPAPEKARDRFLSLEETRAVWAAMTKSESFMAPVFKLLLLTGQRRGEIAALRWSEVMDLEGGDPRLEFPGERTKNHRPHVVPLAAQAAEILREAAKHRIYGSDRRLSDFVFTTTGDNPFSGFTKAKADLDQAAEKILEASIPHWTIHDMRRTVATHMNGELGIEPHVVEAVLNHISGAAKAGVAGTYNKAAYLPQRRAALSAWANFIDTLADKESPAENALATRRHKGA